MNRMIPRAIGFGVILLAVLYLYFKFDNGRANPDVKETAISQSDNAIASNGFTGIKQTRYENGRLETQAPYLNGKLHGNQRRWSPTGQLLESFSWCQGMPKTLHLFPNEYDGDNGNIKFTVSSAPQTEIVERADAGTTLEVSSDAIEGKIAKQIIVSEEKYGKGNVQIIAREVTSESEKRQ